MNERKRMTRKVTLSVHELDLLVDLVGLSKSRHFQLGNQERVTELAALYERLKQSIIKEKP